MQVFHYRPEQWDQEAEAAWRAGRVDEALALTAHPAADDVDACIQSAYYRFQCGHFRDSAQILEHASTRHPGHPMVQLALGTSLARLRLPAMALPHLDAFLSGGLADVSAFDSLAHVYGELGQADRAREFGTRSLQMKDHASILRRGTPALLRHHDPADKSKVIAFTLFGDGERYRRGAIQNVVAAREHYPGWTCRFYVDASVDAVLVQLLAEEGAEIFRDDGGDNDPRHRLTRRFLVSDDPAVGWFVVRDADSLVSAREAAAVADWMAGGKSFHAMRDWHSHSELMLAGMWGGIAGRFPDMAGALTEYRSIAPPDPNWDQHFLRDCIWPAVRDDILVHDRCFEGHGVQPFPGAVPPLPQHVGQSLSFSAPN